MTHTDPTLTTARHVWIAGQATDDEHNLLSVWAWRRWPGMPIPKNSEMLAFWIVSQSIQDGVMLW